MSDSSDESELSNVQRALKRFEPFNLHSATVAPGATDRSIPPWKQRIRPPTTYIASDTKISEKMPNKISLPPQVIEVSPPFTKNDRIKLPKMKFGQNVNGCSSLSVILETPSTASSTSSSSTSATISIAKLNESLAKQFKEREEKLSVYDKNIKSLDKNNVHNNNDSNEMQHDKIRRYSYKNAKENIFDDVFALSTDTADDTIIRTKSFTHNSEKIHHILKELITTEEHYIKKLESCVANYVKHVTNDDYLPIPLKGQQHLVFREIEEILEFHKYTFYPALADCNYDLDKIIDRIRQYVQQDCFYPYVLYTMNKKKSECVVTQNVQYFTEMQNVIGDCLSLSSLLMEPINRLTKYRLFIESIMKEYMQHNLTTSTMESLGRAENEFKRVLNAVDQSILLNDIVIDNFEINIHHQGKFVKSGNFESNDPKSNKKFSGKLFLFTCSLIYTEYSPNKEKFIYRGFFDCSTLRVRQETNSDKINCEKFSVSDMLPGHIEIEFECVNNNQENWYKILQPIMMKSKNQMSSESSSSLNNTTNAKPINRSPTIRGLRAPYDSIGASSINSISSNLSDQFRFSNRSTMSSGIGSIRGSQCSTTSADQIPEGEIFDQIIYSEKHYVDSLKTCRGLYLKTINDNAIKQKLDTFYSNFEKILTHHQNEFYPKFSEFEMSYASLFYLYEIYLNSHNIMEAYKNYAVVAADACDILKALCKDREAKSALQQIDVFVKLPIHQNKYYISTIDQLIKEYMRGDYMDSELIQQAASLQSNFSKKSKQIDETFKLYSIKQNKSKLHHYGICEYSDTVSLDKSGPQNHRICIMERGLICIKFKTIKDIKEEDYREIVFSNSYLIKIHLRHSVKNANRLHISTADQKSILLSLTFGSDILKTKFLNLIGLKLERKTEI